MREISRSFRAMNTDVVAVVVADDHDEADAALHDVEHLFTMTEAVLSRFRPESELSRLNHSAGTPVRVSPLLYAAVEVALAAARATNGLFDPTVLGALEAAGYDRSFELIAQRAARPASGEAENGQRDRSDAWERHETPGMRPTWRDVRLDPRTRTISLPPDVGIDLGGIGKGWTVDRAADRLRRFRNFAIDAGGDIYASGVQADRSPWTIGVEDPRDARRDLLTLAIRDRAVATSTVARRRWHQDGRERHHLIDPRTGQPSQSAVLAATVVADSVARAETLTKAALLLGPGAGRRFLDAQPNAEGLLVLADGQIVQSDGFHEVLHGTSDPAR